MTTEDMEIAAGRDTHEISSRLGNLADIIAEGHGDIVQAELSSLYLARIQLNNIIAYLEKRGLCTATSKDGLAMPLVETESG